VATLIDRWSHFRRLEPGVTEWRTAATGVLRRPAVRMIRWMQPIEQSCQYGAPVLKQFLEQTMSVKKGVYL